MNRRTIIGFALVLAAGTAAAQPEAVEQVLIRTPKPYAKLVAAIEARRGKVTQQYKYIDAVAAQIPVSALTAIRALAGAASMQKDAIVNLPDKIRDKPFGVARPLEAEFEAVRELSAVETAGLPTAQPAAYIVNNSLMGLDPLHAAGKLGNGVIVAVIDSGIRPGFPHITLNNAVIGGEDFVGDGLGFSNFSNNGHGTFVSGMIAANVAFTFSNTNIVVKALNAYAPGAAIPQTSTTSLVPMVGSAPAAKIYALRVFGPSGGAPTSTILKAIDRVIELRELYDKGDPSGLSIRVCNMSLGGATVDAGDDLEDRAIDAMLAHDIVPVIAAGNAGPATLTVGSPGTSHSAITVGAANLARNERILRDIQYGFGIGALYRPSSETQMAYFSSRGPNADGQTDPDILSNGFGNFGMGLGSTVNSISWGSGTSFSTPSVAGVAAVLRQAVPSATATQIRNAILASGNTAIIPAADAIDQGHGYVNAKGAYDLLVGGEVATTLESGPKSNSNVKVNIEHGSTLKVENGNVSQTLTGLKPGARRDILFNVTPNTAQILISLSGFTAALPPAQQNQLFGDDLLVAVHSAKTSSIGEGDYQYFDYVQNGTIVVNNPESGILRVSVNGDWTNAGPVGVTATIASVKDPIPGLTVQDKIATSTSTLVPFTVPAGAGELNVRLGWREDWGSYPSADIDLILLSPTNQVNLDGATLSNPETAVVKNPAAGQWIAVVDAFDIPSGSDKFELRIAIDGNVLRK